jgi:signal transduction histidine kinase
MLQPAKDIRPPEPGLRRLLAYIADLELEVDRLRRHNHIVLHEVQAALEPIRQACAAGGAPAVMGVAEAVEGLTRLLHDLRDLPGYHPVHDQVIAIAVRPLAEQVFRWQQRVLGARGATLHLELESEYVEWFPARLRHILDNLVSNALRYRDPAKSEAWVRLGLRVAAGGYEFRVTDNGVGLPPDEHGRVFDLFYRASPARAAGLGVGLAVVQLLVEQSGGTLAVDSGAGQGSTFVAVLPRYEVDDYLA